MPGDERRPKNLEGLLKFCLNSTKAEDASGNTPARQLSDQEKAWMREAIDASTGANPVKLMIEDVKLLSNMQLEVEGDLETMQINALEEIKDFCEDLDFAKDFQKIGGYALLPHLLVHSSSELRWRCADLVATLVQNNPYCQKAALDLDLMRILLDVLSKEEVELVRIKTLYAVSCLSREYEDGVEALVKHDGISVLIRAMQSNINKLQIKSAFLISYLCSTSPKLKGMLTDVGIVEQLIGLLHTEHAPYHEHVLAALVNIVQDNTPAKQECRRPELQLRSLLQQRIQLLAGKEEFLEEENWCKTLQQTCFTDSEQPDK